MEIDLQYIVKYKRRLQHTIKHYAHLCIIGLMTISPIWEMTLFSSLRLAQHLTHSSHSVNIYIYI